MINIRNFASKNWLKFLQNQNKIRHQFCIHYHNNNNDNEKKSFHQTVKELFDSKSDHYNNQLKEQQTDIKTEVDYYELAKNIQDASADSETVKFHLMQIYKDIKKAVDDSYQNKTLLDVLKHVPSQDLCHFAVEQFIGSMTQPKNPEAMKLLLNNAEINAVTEHEKLEVQYYRTYLNKLEAVQTGNGAEFEKANEELIELSQKRFPLAMHIVAKEVYKVALNSTGKKHKKQKKQMIEQSAAMFQEAAGGGAGAAFFYLGDLAQVGDLPGGIDLAYAYDCFLISASMDHPLAFFKLAQFYKNGMIVKKDGDLEYYYTKKAAEMGVVEAQHNLACMYLEGQVTKYDSIKALAWFTQASASEFVHSMFNCARLYMSGTEDGKIRQNYKAALIYLEKIEKKGQINVDKLINECVDKLAQKEEEKEQQQQQNQQQQQEKH